MREKKPASYFVVNEVYFCNLKVRQTENLSKIRLTMDSTAFLNACLKTVEFIRKSKWLSKNLYFSWVELQTYLVSRFKSLRMSHIRAWERERERETERDRETERETETERDRDRERERRERERESCQNCFMQLFLSLREKCPNTEFFMVRIFLYSNWIQENTGQKKPRIWTIFRRCMLDWLKWKRLKLYWGIKSIRTKLKVNAELNNCFNLIIKSLVIRL